MLTPPSSSDQHSPGTPASSEAERRFLAELPTIERVIAAVSNRNALTPAFRDDFRTWVLGQLVANDFAIMSKFGGRSSLSTFLAVVIGNKLRDFRNATWGRWRPSAAATRMGPVAMRLEELTVRDRCSVREAIGILQSAGVAQDAAELTRMAATLSRRVPEVEVSIESAAALPGTARVDTIDVREERVRVTAALHDAVDTLPDEDRLITRMRFWDGVSIADIARILHIEQKPLYRRVEAIQRRLLDELSRMNVSESDVIELLAEDETW